MDAATFNSFRELVYEKSGITLGAGKEALVSARVGKRMRELHIAEFRDYLRLVNEDRSGQELVQLIDAISTNVTSFFREPVHFDLLRQLVADWAARGQRRFRVWSAASSTGEEPYTIAITLMEALGQRDLDVKILATDISTRVLEQCRQGVYSADKLQTMPAALRDRYFDPQRRSGEVAYQVKPALQRLITFSRLNLSSPPFPMKGPFDVVFCRNVMIYFDNLVRGNLLAEIHRLLRPGGYLMVGHAESLTGMMSTFKAVRPSVYSRG